MAKIQLLAVISIDGCPMKLHPRKRLLQTEDYGMDEIRANALYKLTSDYSVSVLQEWREEGGSICHLLEVTAGNTEYANGLLRMNVIDEIILYVVPTIDGNGAHFFKSALPMNDWRLMENKTYSSFGFRIQAVCAYALSAARRLSFSIICRTRSSSSAPVSSATTATTSNIIAHIFSTTVSS